MTKLQNKLYGAFMILCAILEFLLIIGAYLANHFTKTRMGMLRHMVYLNSKWESLIPIPFLKLTLIVVIIALVVFAFVRYRSIKANTMLTIMAILLVLLSLWTLYFLIFIDTKIYRSYYILSMCFVLSTILQNVIYHCLCSVRKKVS